MGTKPNLARIAWLFLVVGLTANWLIGCVAVVHQNHNHHQQHADQQHVEQPINAAGGAGKIASDAATVAAAQQILLRPTRHSSGAAANTNSNRRQLIDLSHPLHNGTLHWPKNSGFKYVVDLDGQRKSPHNESYHVKSDSISAAIHSGTHLDAPVHFSKTSWTVEQIPLERLVDVPVSVIDVSEKVKSNRSYCFTREDFLDSKTNKSRVQPQSVVLVYTGLSQLYDQGAKAYLGTETDNINQMQVPGFSGEAAKYLVDLGILGVGLDSISADGSQAYGANETFDPVAHTLFNSNNIYILENVSKNLHKLVEFRQQRAAAVDADHDHEGEIRLTIAPLPIVGGSGSPVRLIATIGSDSHCHCYASNSAARAASATTSSSPIMYLFITVSATLIATFITIHKAFSR